MINTKTVVKEIRTEIWGNKNVNQNYKSKSLPCMFYQQRLNFEHPDKKILLGEKDRQEIPNSGNCDNRPFSLDSSEITLFC